ncbi:hypothetical protein HDU83_000059 [Entophlyctis luteolus]|nr:hypothetical protein HDU83_000059 [Entophlyctis luteolus]KAJ3395279.1 hypothetical protein HDU84_000046 [Entophlyctis sp. JEL0112]
MANSNDVDFEPEVRAVLLLCPGADPDSVRIDLRHSGSADATVNRILDGAFLAGTLHDRSLVVLDGSSDDGDNSGIVNLTVKQRPTSKITSQTSNALIVIESSDDDEVSSKPSVSVPAAAVFNSSANQPEIISQGSLTSAHNQTRDQMHRKSKLVRTSSWLNEYALSDSDTDLVGSMANNAEIAAVSVVIDAKKMKRTNASDGLLSSFIEKEFSAKSDDEDPSEDSTNLESSLKKKNIPDTCEEYESDDSVGVNLKKLVNNSSIQKICKRARKLDGSRAKVSANKNLLEKEAKEKEKAERTEAKARLRAEETEKKRLLKEAKGRERLLSKLAKKEEQKNKLVQREANKIRTKHDAVKLMTIAMDPKFVSTAAGSKIAAAIHDSGASLSVVEQKIETAICWFRIVNREWDSTKEIWIPCQEQIIQEPRVLIILSAQSISQMIVERTLENFIDKTKSLYENNQVIIFVEHLKEFLKIRTKAIDSQIRGQIRGVAGNSSRMDTSTMASKEDFDDALFWLQMAAGCFIQLSDNIEESGNLIASFTASIAMIPERRSRSEQQLRLNFGDTVKSGESTEDVWRRVLMEIKPCSESLANAILAVYPTYRSLMEAYMTIPSQSAREKLLENLDVHRIASARRIGPAMSRKICLALTCDDPNLQVFDPPPPKPNFCGGTSTNPFQLARLAAARRNQ